MTVAEKRVLFDRFSFPVLKGLYYLMDEQKEITDYLFINEPHEKFSMYFEVGQRPFEAPGVEAAGKEYCLFELKRPRRRICFYCPERNPNRESVMWYFYVEILDEADNPHILPGQVRMGMKDTCIKAIVDKPRFIEVLEKVKLNKNYFYQK